MITVALKHLIEINHVLLYQSCAQYSTIQDCRPHVFADVHKDSVTILANTHTGEVVLINHISIKGGSLILELAIRCLFFNFSQNVTKRRPISKRTILQSTVSGIHAWRKDQKVGA